MNYEQPYNDGMTLWNEQTLSRSQTELWRVSDICFAAALKTKGIEPVDIDRTDINKIAFLFTNDNHFQIIMDEYYGRRMYLDAHSLFSAFKQIKTIIYGNSYVSNKAGSQGEATV
jgi:hypothetical protein